jgi:hypothetical protein
MIIYCTDFQSIFILGVFIFVVYILNKNESNIYIVIIYQQISKTKNDESTRSSSWHSTHV